MFPFHNRVLQCLACYWVIIIIIITGSIRVLNQPSRLLHFVYDFLVCPVNAVYLCVGLIVDPAQLSLLVNKRN
jgi:hypothetical protein